MEANLEDGNNAYNMLPFLVGWNEGADRIDIRRSHHAELLEGLVIRQNKSSI
jgi:hypothetical protein